MSSELQSNPASAERPAPHRAAPSSKNLPLVYEDTASPEALALFSRYRERFGRADLPGIMLCFATNTALLKGMLEIAENFLFRESLLSRHHKEMIATYLSRQNACDYCADSHAFMLQMQGGSSELICSLQAGDLNPALLTNAELALLRFAGKVNAASSSVTHTDVEAAMNAGWTQAQVAEAVHVAALFAAFNRIANGFGLPTPFPDGL